jgi:hypothetical protein
MTATRASFTILAFLLQIAIARASSFLLHPKLPLAGRTNAALRETVKATDAKAVRGGDDSGNNAGARIFLDMEVAGQAIGRLEFEIPNVNLLPLHIENVMKLCIGSMSSIDPQCKYVGCEFQHSPQFVEGFAQYRWGHTLKGRGRNAVGRADDRISDPESMRKCTHSIYGGQYYGLDYETDVPKQIINGLDTTVVLTVPLVGPGRGSTDLAIVRVGESPQEWKERLLLNTAVLGWLDPSSLKTLHAMARQTQGPPKVVGSGVI